MNFYYFRLPYSMITNETLMYTRETGFFREGFSDAFGRKCSFLGKVLLESLVCKIICKERFFSFFFFLNSRAASRRRGYLYVTHCPCATETRFLSVGTFITCKPTLEHFPTDLMLLLAMVNYSLLAVKILR